jgi:hypothetical protein
MLTGAIVRTGETEDAADIGHQSGRVQDKPGHALGALRVTRHQDGGGEVAGLGVDVWRGHVNLHSGVVAISLSSSHRVRYIA